MSADATPVEGAGPDSQTPRPALIAGLLTAVAGSSGFLVVPMVVAALRHSGVAEGWIGLIGSADPTGMFFGALIALHPSLRSRPRLFVLIALSSALVCNLGSTLLSVPALLLVLRGASGFSGGLALALSLGNLARSRIPDRSYALLALMQMLFSSFVAWLADAGRGGLTMIYLCMFGLQIVGILATLLVDAHRDATVPGPSERERKGPQVPAALTGYTIAGNFLAAGGFLMLWANVQAVAADAGMASRTVIAIFDCGLAGGLLGALVPMLGDGRRWRGPTVACLFLVNLVTIAVIATTSSFLLFSAAAFLFQFSTATAFLGFGAVSEADPGGNLPIVHVLAVKAGFGLAPLFASQILDHFGLATMVRCSFAATLLAMLAYGQLIRLARNSTARRFGA